MKIAQFVAHAWRARSMKFQ